MKRGIFLVAALALTACPSGKKCNTNADCTAGQICSVMSGTCVADTGMGGGIGGGLGGGLGGGTGGGTTGGGTGGGSTGGGTGGGTNTGGESCEMAATITPGTTQGDTTGKMNTYDPGCTGDVTPGPDAVYKINVPAGKRLTATATPELATMGNQFDLAVYLIASPPSNCTNPDGGMELACLSAADNPNALESPETASYFNATGAAQDVFIIVDSYWDVMTNNPDGGIGASNEGRFTLTTTLTDPVNGDRCDTALPLTAGTALADQNLALFGDDYQGQGTLCDGSPAADATYSIAVMPGQLLALTVTPDMAFDPVISVSDGAAACGVTCLASVDSGGDGIAERYTYKNTTAATQTLFFVIDGYNGSTGTFSILADVSTPPADDVCAAPVALTPGTPLMAQTFSNYSNDYTTGTGTGCAFASGADRVYSVLVPDGQRLTVTATPTATANPSLSLVDGAANCGTACLASANAAGTGGTEVLSFTNRSGGAKTYLLVVDFTAASSGTFGLSAVVDTPPGDDVCEMPTLLTSTLTGQTTLGYTNDYQNGTGTVGCSTTGTTGLDRVYQVAVGIGQRGVVTVTPEPDGGYNPSINLVEGAASVCGAMPRVCAAGANSAGSNAPEQVSLFNTTGAVRTFFAIVDSTTGGGNYSISYAAGVPGVDDTCTTNTTTLAAGTRMDNLTGFFADYTSGAGCRTSRGPDRVYKVPLTANQKFTATVTPTTDGGFDPVINFIPGPAANCEATPRTCRGGVDATLRNQAETAGFTNNTGGAMDLFVVVADYSADSTSRDFSLVSTVGAAPAGESCGVPQALTAGALPGQTTTGLTADVVFAPMATGCAPTFYPDRVYSISVGAGQTLTVTATPATFEDLIINIVDGPAAACNNVTACLTSADDGFDGDPEVATYTNATGAAKTVFVQLSGYDTDQNYGLTVTLQ